MSQYPKWKYHKLEKPRLVHDQYEDKALGSAWVESPTEIKESVKETKKTLKKDK